MKDIFLKKDISDGSSSLPKLISMFQYNSKWAESNWNWKDNNGETRKGNLGDHNSFQFSLDAYYYNDENDKDKSNEGIPANTSDHIGEIIYKLGSHKFPMFKKETLEEYFYIVEIPDYGNQAMSRYYRDFLVHVYTNKGAKIWNKYIAILRNYYSKTAYILIDKSNNIKEKLESSVNIRVIFKNNIDKVKGYKIISQQGNIDTKKNSILFNGDISYILRDIENYCLKINDQYIQLDKKYGYVKKISFIDHGDSDGRIALVRKNSASSDINDYFRQEFMIRYGDNPDDFKRGNASDLDIKLTITFDKNIISLDEYDDQTKINLVTLHDLNDALYSNNEKPYDNNIPVVYYTEDGKLSLEEPTDGEFEIIPEYNNRARYILTNKPANSINLKTLKFLDIYGISNYKFQCIGFKDGFLAVGENPMIEEIDTSNIDSNFGGIFDTIILYNTGIELDDSVKINCQECGTKGWELKLDKNINKLFDLNNSEGDGIIQDDKITFREITPAFVLTTRDGFKPDLYAICRAFPIKLVKEIVDEYTVFYRLPEYIFSANNRNVINSIECTIVSTKKFEHPENIKIFHSLGYDNKYESFKTEETYDNKLATLNIINFNNRNI